MMMVTLLRGARTGNVKLNKIV